MYPPPDGQDLTEEQARELDDTFLASDPFQYFSSRIASLLTWHECAPMSDVPLPEPEPGSIRAEFNQYLQRRAADGPFKDLDVHAQAARFRVAASDFNQLHWHWLDRKAEDLLLGHYARITGRDLRTLYAQVRVTRLLWHLRTYNFYTLVHGEAPGAHAAHLDHAAGLLSDIAPQRVG